MRLPSVYKGGKALWIGCVALSLASCNTNECYDNRNTMPLAGFYSSGTPARSVSVDSLKVYAMGVPGDSVLLKPSTSSINELYLPFNTGADRTAYVFTNARTSVSDTVTFSYSARPWFASEACGVVYRFEMNGISWSGVLIDSVTCPGEVITNRPVENLKIYFKAGAMPASE